jgi:eukaryotic-like serine/threonine-protein kinase
VFTTMNEREIFTAARGIAGAAARVAFLDGACGGDSAVRGRIEALLGAADAEDSFLKLDDTAGIDSAARLEQAGDLIGPYKLLEQIGEGGFGTVFMAEQTQPVRRVVALKLIKPGMDSRQVIARFEAERQALAIMDHPNIARVFDAGTTASGRPYFVMELVKGIPITTFCDHQRLGLAQRLELFLAVCAAIQHAHNKGVIHRDIKPGNVLVALYDDRPVPKVIDFGVAKATGQQLTERTLHTGFGAVVGSIEYMSPEQASFNQLDVDTRSDVYSLGVLLYELLAGSPPLPAAELKRGGLLESLRMIRENEPPCPSRRLSTAEGLPGLAASRAIEPARLTSQVRGELDWIAMKALEKDRNRRYETASGLGEEIGRFLRGEAVLAAPPGAWYRLRKLARQHRRGLALAVVALCVAGMAGFGTWWMMRQERFDLEQRSDRTATAVNEAAQALGLAEAAPIGRDSEWIVARGQADRVSELLDSGPVNEGTSGLVRGFLNRFAFADADRRIAEQIERVVITSATHEDLESWQRMEREFRELFASQGIDFDQLPHDEIARRIKTHPSAERLCDALELYIGTLGQMSAMGGSPATAETMQPWADAMYAADDDPVRTGIRKLLYSGKPPTTEQVNAVVMGADLKQLSARTLSWLAGMYAMAGNVGECDRVFRIALEHNPSDFMVNFDFAYMQAGFRNWPEAIRYFLRCTAIRPDVGGVWRALGNAFRENGEFERSREALEKSAALDPAHAPIFLDLARTWLKLDVPSAAEQAAREAIRLGSRAPRAQHSLGEALFNQKKYVAAIVALEECQRLSQEFPNQSVDCDELVEKCRQALSASGQPPNPPDQPVDQQGP